MEKEDPNELPPNSATSRACTVRSTGQTPSGGVTWIRTCWPGAMEPLIGTMRRRRSLLVTVQLMGSLFVAGLMRVTVQLVAELQRHAVAKPPLPHPASARLTSSAAAPVRATGRFRIHFPWLWTDRHRMHCP